MNKKIEQILVFKQRIIEIEINKNKDIAHRMQPFDWWKKHATAAVSLLSHPHVDVIMIKSVLELLFFFVKST